MKNQILSIYQNTDNADPSRKQINFQLQPKSKLSVNSLCMYNHKALKRMLVIVDRNRKHTICTGRTSFTESYW